eukprot:11156033-Lingulodinium_polyedra.AAC.1
MATRISVSIAGGIGHFALVGWMFQASRGNRARPPSLPKALVLILARNRMSHSCAASLTANLMFMPT